jgi:predicted Fe-Mo cluster-binding NifX family protein
MRIAVSANDNNGLESQVSPHFGRCPYFVLADVDGQEIGSVRTMSNPHYNHHQPGQVPAFIQSQGVDVMLTGGMGGRALGFFRSSGIQPVTGAAGTVKDALQQYLNGELSEGGPCRESVEHQHGQGHR